MANNFRYILAAGQIGVYVSKAGDDVNNNGLSPDSPKKTLAGAKVVIDGLTAGNIALIIGSGTYEEAVPGSIKYSTGSVIVGDGNVVLKSDGIKDFNVNVTPSALTLVNLTIDGYPRAAIRNSVNNCIFKNIPGNITTTSGTMTSCMLINCPNISSRWGFDYCIFIDSNATNGGNNRYTNSYFNANSYITFDPAQAAPLFDNNNIMGMIRATATGAYQTLAQFQQSYPAYNTKSINMPPRFNNAAKLDFTLQSDSPHINAASDSFKNIGGTSFAVSYAAQTAAEWQLANGAVISTTDGTPDLVLNGTDIRLAPGKNQGTITSAPIRVSVNPVQIQAINYNGLFLFNKDAGQGASSNNNVPDSSVRAGNQADGSGNPDRLSYLARWTDSDFMPGADVNADWPSTPLLAPGAWVRFEWNTQPVYDSTGMGNGSGLFNKNDSPGYVNATWMQFRVTLTNLYV